MACHVSDGNSLKEELEEGELPEQAAGDGSSVPKQSQNGTFNKLDTVLFTATPASDR